MCNNNNTTHNIDLSNSNNYIMTTTTTTTITKKKKKRRTNMMKQQVFYCITLLLLFVGPTNTQAHGFSRDSSGRLRKAAADLPDPDLATPDSSQPSGLYQPPEEIEVIRLNDTSIVIRWDISQQSEQLIQLFRIQYKSTKKNVEWTTDDCEISRTDRAHQINGLKPGNYYIIVSALYDNDDNRPSKQIKYTLRARSKISDAEMPAKTAPKIGWWETSTDLIRFKWRYPVMERDIPNFGYLVFYRSAHSVGDFIIYNTMDEEVEIAELEKDTPYEAKVVAYNTVGISDFSDTMILVTRYKNGTVPEPITTTTISPLETTTIDDSMPESNVTSTATQTTTESPLSTTTTSSIDQTAAATTTTPAASPPNPTIVATTNTSSKQPTNVNDSTDYNETIIKPAKTSLASLFSRLMAGRDDTTLAIKYSLFFLLPIIVITSVLICLIKCHRKRKSPPPSIDDQNDFEINAYFKNSFPGMGKDLTMMVNAHHNGDGGLGHQGFVNKHPHIHDQMDMTLQQPLYR